jgi:hypothetical protein
VGAVLAVGILYEIQDIGRFSRTGTFISCARQTTCTHDRAAKRNECANTQIENVHLRWVFRVGGTRCCANIAIRSTICLLQLKGLEGRGKSGAEGAMRKDRATRWKNGRSVFF